MTATRHVPRWPLFLIAAPAAVAIWSGWVGLGAMCGFGLVEPLPGIVAWHLNTAITLPVGIEAYGAYALGAWLTPAAVPARAQTFARRSAIGALVLGMTGQVIFHLLAAAHATRAPWPVVVLVACLPVVTLGLGAALTHLLRAVPGESAGQIRTAGGSASEPHPEGASRMREQPASGGASGAGTRSHPKPQPKTRPPRGGARISDADAEMHFAADLAAGDIPSLRRIQRELHVGQQRATVLRQQMQSLIPATETRRTS